jgi:hypothetical protein
MAAMMAAARSPLPLPAIGAAALALAVPVVKVPPVVVAVAVSTVLEYVGAEKAAVGPMVLATLRGISESASREAEQDELRRGIAPGALGDLGGADLGVLGAEGVAAAAVSRGI